MTWWDDLLSVKYLADWKDAVVHATIGALPAYTRTGNLITADANGAAAAIDGIAPTLGGSLLLWHGASGADNGIYTWTTLGSGSGKWSLTRREDADTDSDVTEGLCCRVARGTAHGGQIARLTTTGAIALNTTALTFVLESPAGLPAAGALDEVIVSNGAAWVAGAVNLAAPAAVGASILRVTNGGTGIVLGAANTVLRVNAGGTAIESVLLTTANLSATAGIVGTQLSATAGIVGTQLSATAAIAATQLAAGAVGTVLAGGASNAFTATPTVTSVLCGASAAAGNSVTAAGMRMGETVASPTWQQDARTTDAAPQSITITPQAPFATATGANRDPGGCIVVLSAPAGASTVEAAFTVKRGATVVGKIGPYPGAPTLSLLWLVDAPSTSNYTILGSSGGVTLNSPSGGSVELGIGGGVVLSLLSTTFDFKPTAAAPQFGQSIRTSDAATNNLTVAAQSAWASSTGANVHGGHLLLRGGAEKGAAAGKKGGVRLQLNATTETLVEATEVAIGQRVVALCLGADVTATELPASTGDRVVYVANCATAPTATPVSGGILYASAGNLFWRNTAGVSTQLN